MLPSPVAPTPSDKPLLPSPRPTPAEPPPTSLAGPGPPAPSPAAAIPSRIAEVALALIAANCPSTSLIDVITPVPLRVQDSFQSTPQMPAPEDAKRCPARSQRKHTSKAPASCPSPVLWLPPAPSLRFLSALRRNSSKPPATRTRDRQLHTFCDEPTTLTKNRLNAAHQPVAPRSLFRGHLLRSSLSLPPVCCTLWGKTPCRGSRRKHENHFLPW
jgi:hypothetical protein